MTTLDADSSQNAGDHATEFWEPRRAMTLSVARRHSAFIKMARKGLAGLSALVLLMLVYYFVTAPKTVIPKDNPDETVKMVNPIYRGRTADMLPYRITADEAVRFIQNPDDVNLIKPVLNFVRAEGAGESAVLAVSGLYNSKEQILELKDDVKLSTDDGYNCATSQGRIFVKNKRIEGTQSISCNGKFGMVSGKAYEINDGYSEFVFKGGVKALLNPKEASDALRGVSVAGAPKKKRAKPAVSFGNEGPIDVLAQKAVYKGQTTILTGKVDILQLGSRISANKMVIYRKESEINESGSIKYGDVQRIIATGSFKYSNPENSVVGDKGVYERNKNIITVTSKVILTQKNGSTVSGCKLFYDLTTNRARFDGSCIKNKETGDRVVIKIGQ